MIEKLIPLKDGKKVFIRYYNQLSNAETILYLHGGPGDNCENFNYAAYLLSKNFNIVMLDQRGVLRSDRVEENEPLIVQMLVDDCEYIREQLNIEQWILIGHSYGGFLALLYAYQFSKSIKAVIYENPNWSSLESIKTLNRNTSNYLRNINEYELAKEIDYKLSNCNNFETLAKLQMEIPWEYRKEVYYIKEWTDEIKRYCSLEDISSDQWENSIIHSKRIIADKININNYIHYIKEISCGSLLIKGDHDPVISIDFQDYFVQNSLNGKLEIVEDCGHFIHTDQVKDFCNIVTNFINANEHNAC
ncbi:proline iminopeptidase [Clostridium saccharoperbutylacetonicum]|uniref:Alpha/beta hydrolase superfamily n=1 Tax=Clostridium saccharoperbutylacetonicum N1-4(HMT) TaxID=931276 RepID=M1MDQ8_9CLOT|nr:alpha/beta fold hydrolase [Clostridium saccharoperbutylacetonicum]AGF56054.1 alpha/beta hydrolase superfamily [Clostridium saccharoperbutylacetonicum N1-4(HMT)]NRT63207.1 proline iminopeptidase [Clostridium saccharoperbutylacetonicum]NSB26567.1 proline iminopeptidase [Clostridium saccharoperbutylacetonicum]NSB45918.1 proline iminopeptidase [Clostridium saccharoperbutylacetonicum]